MTTVQISEIKEKKKKKKSNSILLDEFRFFVKQYEEVLSLFCSL